MKIQQIRNATVKIEYDGKTFLIDPWLAPKHMTGAFFMLPPLAFLSRKKERSYRHLKDCLSMETTCAKAKYRFMPLSALPFSVDEINRGVDAYLVTHIHADHAGLNLDGTIGTKLDKNIPIYTNTQEDAEHFRYSGFDKVTHIDEKLVFDKTEIIKTKAIHGTKIPCGDACGYIFKSPNEKTLYVCGDTIWCPEVQETINSYRPDVIITNNCAAEFANYGRLIMDDKDLYEVCKAAPDAVIIASHMDTVPHATLTRKTLKEKLDRLNLSDRVLIPDDGECYSF